ncbi:MAG: hypothetical protein Q8O68_01235 [Candidatus Daviesbacteria bacterium]|nr:hypothetical protein [Candidatus Daviesbacteria bacterium]
MACSGTLANTTSIAGIVSLISNPWVLTILSFASSDTPALNLSSISSGTDSVPSAKDEGFGYKRENNLSLKGAVLDKSR